MSSRARFVLAGLVLALALAALSPLASTRPDGLDSVAEKHGFADRATDSPLPAPMPDYWDDSPAKKILAGVVGTLCVFALTYGAMALLARRRGGKAPTT